MDELELKTNARRAQGGLGLLSHTISVHSLQKSIPLIPREEREEEEKETGRGRQEEEMVACCSDRQREDRKREWGGREIFIPH